MFRIWIIIATGIGAMAQEKEIEKFFYEAPGDSISRDIHGKLSTPGLHDCYTSEDRKMYAQCNNHIRGAGRTTLLQLTAHTQLFGCCVCPWATGSLNIRFTETEINEKTTSTSNRFELCCISRGFVQPESGCGIRKPDGDYKPGKARQKRDNVRTVLLGEYPWRALIWRNEGDEGPFCAGTVISEARDVILTSASCALKYNADMIMVTFNRTRAEEFKHISVQEILVHEEYDKDKPFVNDIALLVLNTESVTAPAWVMPACWCNRPPMIATVCTVMSPEDYFIDTAVPVRRQCEVDNNTLHVGQMCSVTMGDEYTAEMGAGLFCQDYERIQNFNYYVSGITLQVRGQLIKYTDVSHFQEWIQKTIHTISTD